MELQLDIWKKSHSLKDTLEHHLYTSVVKLSESSKPVRISQKKCYKREKRHSATARRRYVISVQSLSSTHSKDRGRCQQAHR